LGVGEVALLVVAVVVVMVGGVLRGVAAKAAPDNSITVKTTYRRSIAAGSRDRGWDWGTGA